MTPHTARRAFLAAVLLAAAGRAPGQPRYPDKPITLIVPFAPGGIADITARTVAQAMGATLGQTVVVDNRPSAGSIVGSSAVAQAAPDGHTLLLMSNANAVSASLFKKLPFDVQKDFAPIGTLAVFDLAVFVDAGSRYRSIADLLADAKARPGKLSIGTISTGSTQHLAAELFKSRTGIDAVVVPYKSTPAVLTALRARDRPRLRDRRAAAGAGLGRRAAGFGGDLGRAASGPGRHADAGAGGCCQLQRRVVECARGTGRNSGRDH